MSGYSAHRPQLRSVRVLLLRGGGTAAAVPVEPCGAALPPAVTVSCSLALRNSAALFNRGVSVGSGGAAVLVVVIVPSETERLFLGPAKALEAGRDADADDESDPPVVDAGLSFRSLTAVADPPAPGEEEVARAFATDDEASSSEGRPAAPFAPAPPPPVRRLAAFVILGAIAGSRSAFKSAETGPRPGPVVLGRPDAAAVLGPDVDGL